jgi:hypothetical protein
VPKTNVRCLFKDGINVRKCSNLVDYRTASILRWERNNGYLSPPSMLMAAAKFQWEDPAAGWLGGCQSKSGRDQADLSGSRNTGKIVVKYAMGLCKISTVPFFPSGEPSMSNDVPRMPDPVENNSFLHSRIFASRNIPQDNELHGPNRVDPGIEAGWIQDSDRWVLSVYGQLCSPGVSTAGKSPPPSGSRNDVQSTASTNNGIATAPGASRELRILELIM